jgi:CBS domain-containing protein
MLKIKSVMHSPAYSVEPQSSVADAAELLVKKRITTVLVESDRKAVGILTQLDLIELLARFKKRDYVYVQITGLEEEPETYDSMYNVIQKSIRRIGRFTKPQILALHVTRYRVSGGAVKYSVHTRLSTSKEMFYASSVDWHLLKVTDIVMRQIERMVRKKKERLVSYKKIPRAKIVREI